jgi:hypothetical protein
VLVSCRMNNITVYDSLTVPEVPPVSVNTWQQPVVQREVQLP